MRLIIDGDNNLWLNFLKSNPGCAGLEFLLSPEWVNILKAQGSEVKVVTVTENNEVLALMVVMKKFLTARFFYWYAPRGPLLKNNLNDQAKKDVIQFLLKGVRRLDQRALFIKLEPANLTADFWSGSNVKSSLCGVYQIRRVADVQPQQTIVLNLNKSLTDIIAAMHPKTRYNIRLAEKKGIKIVLGDKQDLPDFWRLMQATSGRDGFRLHDQKHYDYLLQANNFIYLFFAEYEGKKIATAMMSIFFEQATYLHGGSDYKMRHLMAPYLLQVEMIKKAQQANAKVYDFYGISEEKWPGVTRFKQGFQGEIRSYAGTFDVVFRPAMYKLYRVIKNSRYYYQIAKKYVATK